MRRGEILDGPRRYDACGVYRFMAAVIVLFDVIHVHRLGDARHLIKLAQIVRKVRIIRDAAQVALEVPMIDRVEPDKCREETPVGLGDPGACEIALFSEPFFQPVELLEQRRNLFLVDILFGGKPRLVDALFTLS
jgi:hypothetical protein